MAMLGILWEASLAIYLTVKGFRPSPLLAEAGLRLIRVQQPGSRDVRHWQRAEARVEARHDTQNRVLKPGATMSEPLHLVLTPVRADRAAEFERFVADVVAPAAQAERPDLDNRWRIMRSTGPRDGVVTYALMLEGGSLSDDWDLETVLSAHYGQDKAQSLVQDWAGTLAPIGPWAEAAATAGQEDNQATWTLEPVSAG
jgi:hypothetical protein